MNLVVDLGNSRLKWAQVEPGSPRHGHSMALTGSLADLLDTCWADMDPPRSVLVSNVSGQKNAQKLASWTGAHWDRSPDFFKPTERYRGMVNGYDRPEQLGCDRWAALIGARSLTANGALCVVDCGTAITVDVVNAQNRFIGGVILPGIDLMQDSLLKGTADILERRAECENVLGTTTAQCVSSGSYFGTAGAIDRLLHEACSISTDPKLYITGGDAQRLSPLLGYSLQFEPDLVLIGLAHTLSAP